jgi:DNA invertase Pin-like site-specific DNA recombinase
MAVYAYIRVSTQMQPYESQEYEIKKWCTEKSLPIDRWVTESVSGTKSWEERMLGKTIRKMKPGDLLVCSEISRLGRNMLMIMAILNVCSQRNLHIHTIKDNFDLSDNINSKIIAFAFALAAEIERNLISQRTKEALEAKKNAGMQLGRPRGHSDKVKRLCAEHLEIERLLGSGCSIASVARKYNVHRNTITRCRKQNYCLPDND